jgi:hypothetical protein
MPRKGDARAVTEREHVQVKIRDDFPDKVKSNRKALCKSCVFWDGRCIHGLLPVTLNGQDCPYHRGG